MPAKADRFFIVISGKIEIIDEESFSDLNKVINDICEGLIAVITASGAKTIFKDDTGEVYEISYRLISDASNCYLLIGHGNPIPVILVVQDLLYPSRDPEVIQKDIDVATTFLRNIFEQSLRDEYKDKTNLKIVDTRWLDAPFSLQDLATLSKF